MIFRWKAHKNQETESWGGTWSFCKNFSLFLCLKFPWWDNISTSGVAVSCSPVIFTLDMHLSLACINQNIPLSFFVPYNQLRGTIKIIHVVILCIFNIAQYRVAPKWVTRFYPHRFSKSNPNPLFWPFLRLFLFPKQHITSHTFTLTQARKAQHHHTHCLYKKKKHFFFNISELWYQYLLNATWALLRLYHSHLGYCILSQSF